MNNPIITLLSGPNGSGKTTTAFSIMPDLIDCYEYVNADAIASALSPFKPQEVSIEAGRVMLKRIKELAAKRVSFAFETTLASKSFIPMLTEFKKQGFKVKLVYIWLNSVDLAVERVLNRVRSGGHSVAEEVIRRRYFRSLDNFKHLYSPLADEWAFYDNSLSRPTLIAEKDEEDNVTVFDTILWELIEKQK